jgi:hypothetical protein
VLRVKEVGAVQGKERLASLDRLSRVVHIEITYPAFDFHVHVRLSRLVVPHRTRGADGLVDGLSHHGHGLHADQLLSPWINGHVSPRRRLECASHCGIASGHIRHRLLRDQRRRSARPRTRTNDVDTRPDCQQQHADDNHD